LRIGIDAHFVGVRHGGNEVHFENLIRHLARTAPNGHEYFVFTYRLAARAQLGAERLRFVPLASRSVAWQRGVEIPYRTARLDLDILHVPFNFLPVHRSKKVVTIHDVGFLRVPLTYAPLERARMTWLTRIAARRADHVLTVSQAAKSEIMAYYRLPDDRVTVAPNAVDRTVFRPLERAEIEAFRARKGLAFPYVLFVGTIQPRKNVLTLLRAFHSLGPRRSGHHLVLVGRRGWGSDDVFRFVIQHGLNDVVHHIDEADTADLVGFYNAATVLGYPSLYEGFGVPILEAMSCGCPVVSANTASMPEVYGDAALPFDPQSSEALSSRLAEVLDDETLRATLVRRGFANCARFSWERTAAAVGAVYSAL
jgi:glycosyltransferase involved in cell wall biosynthesis